MPPFYFVLDPVLARKQFPDRDYVEPANLPKDVPSMPELGVTSAPLKSAAFFLGAFCKEYNGNVIRVDMVFKTLMTPDCRRLYALQGREPGSCTLSHRRPSSDALRPRSVRCLLTTTFHSNQTLISIIPSLQDLQAHGQLCRYV